MFNENGYEYYDESITEFFDQIELMKDTLAKSIKEEHIAEMKRLIEENASLREIKRSFYEITYEYKTNTEKLEYEYKRKHEELERTVRKETLQQLLEGLGAEYITPLYVVERIIEKKPKCDKCDEERKIWYTTPLGKKAYEGCLCGHYDVIFRPKILETVNLRLFNNKLTASYTAIHSRDESYTTYYPEGLYGGAEYENVDRFEVIFPTSEECQAFCDWLNNKEKENES